jgi:pyridoxamine 5'-phosphate oxidase
VDTPLIPSEVPDNPFSLFEKWLIIAKSCPEIRDYNAMCLSTVGEDGAPSARMVLLKGVSDASFVFYTNERSRKGRELTKLPKAALTFFWDPLRAQVRVRGTTEAVSVEESDSYFQTRSRKSQLSAWASAQSETLLNRELLQEKFKQAEQKFQGSPVTRPPYWHGYRVIPSEIEFWKEGEGRIHDRLCYTLSDGYWSSRLLYP